MWRWADEVRDLSLPDDSLPELLPLHGNKQVRKPLAWL